MSPGSPRPESRAELRGSIESFGNWMKSLETKVFGFALRRLGRKEDALDVVQETFLAAYEGRDRSPPEAERQAAWLFGIASNKTKDLSRSRARSSPQADFETVASGLDPHADAEKRETWEGVRACLKTLPEEQREALLLKTREDLSYAEIAALQGVPVGTVRSRIAQARAGIRNRLGGLS